jgi:hypothetical protein
LKINISSVKPVTNTAISHNTRETNTVVSARQTDRTNQRQFVSPPPQANTTQNRSNNTVQNRPNNTVQNRPNNTVQNRTSTTMPIPRNTNPDDNSIMCNCNQPAILLTVRKQTANFGKCLTSIYNNFLLQVVFAIEYQCNWYYRKLCWACFDYRRYWFLLGIVHAECIVKPLVRENTIIKKYIIILRKEVLQMPCWQRKWWLRFLLMGARICWW